MVFGARGKSAILASTVGWLALCSGLPDRSIGALINENCTPAEQVAHTAE